MFFCSAKNKKTTKNLGGWRFRTIQIENCVLYSIYSATLQPAGWSILRSQYEQLFDTGSDTSSMEHPLMITFYQYI